MAILISMVAPVRQLVVGTVNTLSLPGTTIAYVTDTAGDAAMDATTGGLSASGTYVLGTPVTLPSSLVPTNYVADLIGRTTLGGAVRITIIGTGRLQLTDDFSSRSRITLAGVGTQSPGGN